MVHSLNRGSLDLLLLNSSQCTEEMILSIKIDVTSLKKYILFGDGVTITMTL